MANIARLSWWKWIPGRTWRIVTTVEAADEIPVRLPPCGAALVGSLTHPKWLAFDCPCKTGHRIMVTLDPAHYPHWTILDEKKLTLSPSVNYQVSDRHCHFRISKGKVFWFRVREERHRAGKR